MGNLVVSALGAIARQSRMQFLQKLSRAEDVQAQFLKTFLKTHQDTRFGQEHRIGDIQTVEEFRSRIPVQSYAGFAAYTEQMANGEENVLVPDPLIYFNISSGSTGQKKLIPVTKRSRKYIGKASRVAMGCVSHAAWKANVPLGKMLFPLSVNDHGKTPTGIAYAPVSTSDLKLMDFVSRQLFANPFEAFQIRDTDSRYYICLLFALRNENLRIISATFPVLALQMCDYLDRYAESLIHDIKTGDFASWLKLDPSLRQVLERAWSAAPQRAAHLDRVLHTYGRLTPQLAWPHLSFMVTARGGTSNFYFDHFPEYFGQLPIFGGTYSCAEGVLGIHREFGTDSVFPAIESAFLEFIPEDQWDAVSPKTLLLSEVQPGQQYRIVFTNYSGFYRYDLGDIVEIDSFTHQAPLMIFRHRRGNVISSSTEKTTEAHVIEVMQRLQREFNVSLENFCITLGKDRVPAPYLVNIEVSPKASLPNLQQFLQAFDSEMKDVQKFYAIKRKDQIPTPRLRILAPGSFEQVRQQMLQRGIAEAQLKFPHVTEDRNWLDGVTVTQEVGMEEG
jgi:hypothetical protein